MGLVRSRISGHELLTVQWHKRLSLSILVALLAITTVLLDIPGKLFFYNTVEFSFHYSQLIPLLTLYAVVVVVVAAVIFVPLSEQTFKNLILIPFGLTVLLWTQGNLFNWQYGFLNGDPIPWKELWWYGAIDLGSWLSLLALLVVFREVVYSHMRTFSLVLIVMNLASWGSNLYVYLGDANAFHRSTFELDESGPVHFSSDKNVIIIIPDTMQSDVVEKLFNESGSTFRDDFAGFTFYRNSVAPSNGTFLSIPATLTGRYFDNATPYPQYIAESYRERSVLSVLAERGYKTYVREFLPSKILLNLDPALITNLVEQQDYSFDNEIKYLMDLSLFRLAPHFLKRYIYNEYDWLLSNGENKSTDRGIGHEKPLPFSPEMFASSEANIVEPVFHLFHFEGSHVPFNKTRSGATIPPSRTAEAFTDKTAFTLSQISALIRRLKIIDGFDNSLIIVAGDHGFSALDDWENGNVGKGMGMNALLIKDFASSGPLKSSDAEMASTKLPSYIFRQLEMSSTVPPLAQETAVTPRRFFVRHLRKERYVHDGYTEYIVLGHSWQDSSWIKYHEHPPRQRLPFCIFNDETEVDVLGKVSFGSTTSSSEVDKPSLISHRLLNGNEIEFVIQRPRIIPPHLSIVFSVGTRGPRSLRWGRITYQINDEDPVQELVDRGALSFGYSTEIVLAEPELKFPMRLKFRFCSANSTCTEERLTQGGALAVFGLSKRAVD